MNRDRSGDHRDDTIKPSFGSACRLIHQLRNTGLPAILEAVCEAPRTHGLRFLQHHSRKQTLFTALTPTLPDPGFQGVRSPPQTAAAPTQTPVQFETKASPQHISPRSEGREEQPLPPPSALFPQYQVAWRFKRVLHRHEKRGTKKLGFHY